MFNFAKERLYRTIAIDSKAKPCYTSAIYLDAIESITLSGSSFYRKGSTILYRAARDNGLSTIFYGKCTSYRLIIGNNMFYFAKERLYRTIAIDSKAKPRDTSAIYLDAIEFITLSGSSFYRKRSAILYRAARDNGLSTIFYGKCTSYRLIVSNSITYIFCYIEKFFPYICYLVSTFATSRYI